MQSHLKGSFGNIEISTVQDNVLGHMKHKHVDNNVASESHVVQVRVQCEIIADRTYAVRKPELCPREWFTTGGQRVDLLHRRGLIWLRTTRLQKGGGLEVKEFGLRLSMTE